MGDEGLQGVELAFQCFLGEKRVHVVVARATKPRETMTDFIAIKLTAIALVLVPRFRDEVVLGQRPD